MGSTLLWSCLLFVVLGMELRENLASVYKARALLLPLPFFFTTDGMIPSHPTPRPTVVPIRENPPDKGFLVCRPWPFLGFLFLETFQLKRNTLQFDEKKLNWKFDFVAATAERTIVVTLNCHKSAVFYFDGWTRNTVSSLSLRCLLAESSLLICQSVLPSAFSTITKQK